MLPIKEPLAVIQPDRERKIMPSRCQSLLRLGIFPLLARIGIVEAAAAGSLTAPASSASGRAWLARVLALAGLLLAGFPASAAPSIGSVQITPDAIAAGAPTTVRVTAVIADPTLLPATVNLQRVNEAGAAVAVLGSLHDDGRNGDAVAGDQVYTLDVVLTETSPLRLRVSAGFQGMVKRVFSAEVLLPINRPPLADAGPDQSVARGKRVSLDGSASRDPEGATLSHTWSLIDRPAGSAATLTDANSVRPTFTADVPGQYIAQLIVRDGPLASAPDTVRITVTDPGLTILYLHADHLGTPRVATNEANVVVWRNLPISEPFGMALPEEDPDGDGQPTIINLRFPGQYFDRETQLHYNYYRDYDPGVGRYVQSDPIGIDGGINTYSYVGGNPVSITDPRGLDNPGMGPYGGSTGGRLPIAPPGHPAYVPDPSWPMGSINIHSTITINWIYEHKPPEPVTYDVKCLATFGTAKVAVGQAAVSYGPGAATWLFGEAAGSVYAAGAAVMSFPPVAVTSLLVTGSQIGKHCQCK
jgi:RHS repeat-associated protein